MPPTLLYAAGSDVGRRRAMNQDSAAASTRLLVVADGMGGHAHGEVASAVAVEAVMELEKRLAADLSDVDLTAELGTALDEAAARLTNLAQDDPQLRGTGTTVVAFLVDGTRIGIAHIGDSRAYMFRDGELVRLTRDHTLVQSLVDEGRITEQEAAIHPRRSWLMRTLQDGSAAEPDLFIHDAVIGDRYLICSDGLTAVLRRRDGGRGAALGDRPRGGRGAFRPPRQRGRRAGQHHLHRRGPRRCTGRGGGSGRRRRRCGGRRARVGRDAAR